MFTDGQEASDGIAAMLRDQDRTRPARAGRRSKIPFQWIDEATPDLAHRYVVKGVIGAGELALIYGPSGCGKTFLTIDLACHVAQGVDWFGRRVRPGLVVYCAAEAGHSILKRFHAWQLKNNPTGESVPVAVIPVPVNLLEQREVAALSHQISEIAKERGEVVLTIIDTLSRSIPGADENSPQDVTKVIGAADRLRNATGSAVLFVHHTGKDQSKGARGHYSLTGAPDSIIAVSERMAVLEKVRDGPKGAELPFDLDVVELGYDEDGDRVTSCIAKPCEDAPQGARRAKLTAAESICLQALQEALEVAGEALPETSTMPKAKRGVKVEDWRTRFAMRYGEDKADETQRKAFYRGREALIAKKVVGCSNPWVWIW